MCTMKRFCCCHMKTASMLFGILGVLSRQVLTLQFILTLHKRFDNYSYFALFAVLVEYYMDCGTFTGAGF